MVNIDTFGSKLSNPLESSEDKAVEDNLLKEFNCRSVSRVEDQRGGASISVFSTQIFRTKSR